VTRFDTVVIGGGIVGLSTAYHLARGGSGSVAVLEKEALPAQHQTGRNSGVIHSGIYYKPGSLKATNCVAGRRSLIEFCEEHGVAHELCGKVIVAVSEQEETRLRGLLKRGQENGVDCEWMSLSALKEREPHVVGRAAVLVRDAGIADYSGVCQQLARILEEKGHSLLTERRVTGILEKDGGVVVETDTGPIRARMVVNCAGLHSDRVARLAGVEPGLQIVPFRGHYHDLAPGARYLCKHLIYPVPDPAYPFLGVHFTRRTSGAVECGPNALLAFAREGYRIPDLNLRDMVEYLGYSGFRALMREHWKQGVVEFGRAVSKRRYLKALRTLIPEVEARHLLPAPAGIRAQAVMPDGSMADDFLIIERPRQIHVCNAPSPAATAGLQIGRYIADRVTVAHAA
jgi:(S)-2-hydroxyglutarate dehydrogenase